MDMEMSELEDLYREKVDAIKAEYRRIKAAARQKRNQDIADANAEYYRAFHPPIQPISREGGPFFQILVSDAYPIGQPHSADCVCWQCHGV
jgi:hypothetical protein